nr:RNA 2',3'-cyclic phosphodiesterase [Magnetospirillum sulfuroxidans]
MFVGLGLPADLATRLEALAGGVPGARWVAARNLHVTLRFIGEVDEAQAEELHDHLCRLQARPLALTIKDFGSFGGAKPRALWAAIKPDPALDRLQHKVEQAAQAIGLAPEGRKFIPHITLAWLKGAPADRVAGFIAHHTPWAAALPVAAFTVYRSLLGAGGAEYQALTEYPLDSK